MSTKFTQDQLEYAIYHVFLPPNLPQSADDQVVSNDTALLAGVSNALHDFRSNIDPTNINAIDDAKRAISRLQDLRDNCGFVNERKLQDAFTDLVQNGGLLPIHVQKQNAAIILIRKDDSITFEFFELSPQNEAVMNTVGRLRRRFPASSVSIPVNIFTEDGCQSTLAHTICKMSHQQIGEMKARVKKAGDEHIEERDTTDPIIVTDFLVTVLSVLGKTVETSQIWKNTREEVLWRGAMFPWQRSPIWLLVRTTLQLFFSRSEPTKTIYKEFMVFFMAKILNGSKCHNLPSDTLYCMVAKISRRLLKLDRDLKYPWLQMVEEVLSSTRCLIEKRWDTITEQSDSDLDLKNLDTLPFQQDVHATYTELDDFIQQISSRQITQSKAAFDPPWETVKLDKSNLPCIPSILSDENADKSSESALFHLLAFENWVVLYLNRWLDSNTTEESCEKLSSSMISYYRAASLHYEGNPERLSIMLLTIMEIWVACDKLACKHNQLLSDYNPDVPYEILQSLILPFKDQMERLNRVEGFIQARRKGAKVGNPSVFSSFGQSKSFAVKYFAKSPFHQNLLKVIENDANQERQKKREEFRQLQAEYNRLMELHNEIDCTFTESVDSMTGSVSRIHSGSCEKCGYRNSADSLTIEVHEWPLPANELRAMSTVFELQVPKSFNHWRTATTYLRVNILKSVYDVSKITKVERTLEQYLKSRYKEDSRRIVLASNTKPNRGTHR